MHLFERKEVGIALTAVRDATRLCRAVQKEVGDGILEKTDKSPVTVADYGSQALICRILQESFPGDPVIAEEDASMLRDSGHSELLNRIVDHVSHVAPGSTRDEVLEWINRGKSSIFTDRFWTVDPIDGTKGFLRKEQYAIALALIENGSVEIAVLACPNLPVKDAESGSRGVVFVAVREQGTHEYILDDKGFYEPHAVWVSKISDPARARFCESVVPAHSSHSDAMRVADRLGIRREPLRMDSQVKYAMVARGDAELYLRFPVDPGRREKIWDHAAGSLIVAESGGSVTDITGRALDFRRGRELERNYGIVATNGRFHDHVLDAIEGIGIAPPV